jgi:hypothetical protein
MPPQHRDASRQSPGEAPEPAQAASRQEEVEEGPFAAGVLDGPDDLRTRQATDDARQPGVHGVGRQPRASTLAIEHPETDQRPERNEHPKAGDLEVTDAEETG